MKEEIVDLVGHEEILFLGPDEGTADFMDWGAEHARERGAPWWKSFTTGKSAATLGGIPHDVWGMTSLSIRQHIIGIFRKHRLDEKQITKVQTGGPDGDLGSNEILLSMDKTVAIIDGSGVIHDPEGLDRDELRRLAKSRKTIAQFDKSKLSKRGYRVLVEDRDLVLPDGEVVVDGIVFRNSAHLRYEADLFVPCGGRPESINISNVAAMCDEDGKCHYKYIVEGANLFITQQARIYLEKRKVVLFKDSSANKGGVTCSSLDVLAGLTLADAEHSELMTFPEGGAPSAFYQAYVKDIQKIIAANAALEFGCIWAEYERAGGARARCVVSDELSQRITDLQDELEASTLFDDARMRVAVIRAAVPPTPRSPGGRVSGSAWRPD